MNPAYGSLRADDEPIPFLFQHGQDGILVQQPNLESLCIIPGEYRRFCLRAVPGGVNSDRIRVYPARRSILGIAQGTIAPAVGLSNHDEKISVFQALRLLYCSRFNSYVLKDKSRRGRGLFGPRTPEPKDFVLWTPIADNTW